MIVPCNPSPRSGFGHGNSRHGEATEGDGENHAGGSGGCPFAGYVPLLLSSCGKGYREDIGKESTVMSLNPIRTPLQAFGRGTVAFP